MSGPVLVLIALVAWCGTRAPRPPLPRETIIGLVAGVVVAIGFFAWMGYEAVPSATELLVISVVAFAASRFAGDATSMIGKAPRSG